jgi:hypothetical protein
MATQLPHSAGRDEVLNLVGNAEWAAFRSNPCWGKVADCLHDIIAAEENRILTQLAVTDAMGIMRSRTRIELAKEILNIPKENTHA